MKKTIGWTWIFILAVAMLLAACGENSNANSFMATTSSEDERIAQSSTNDLNGSMSTESTKDEKIIQTEEIIIADDDYVTAIFEKIYDGSSLGVEGVFYIDIKVKNKTETEIWVYLDGASVNDEMVPMVMSGVPLYVKPEKSGSNAFIISFAQLSIEQIEDVKNIEFDLVICDEETLDDIERVEGIHLDF